MSISTDTNLGEFEDDLNGQPKAPGQSGDPAPDGWPAEPIEPKPFQPRGNGNPSPEKADVPVGQPTAVPVGRKH